jgi:acetoin utilization deacetylase AcuC-like enzyme
VSAVTVPFVWADAVLGHEPTPPTAEVPYRAHLIRDALTDAGHQELPAAAHDDEVLLTVHEAPLVEWLRTAGAERPHFFPTPMMTAGMPWRYPTASQARAGVWCYDTTTPVGPGTWEAARAAVDCALTAVDLVVAGPHRAAYALCRPPGHHAAPAGFGGSCYLNNAAVAAEALTRHGMRVAVVDVDAHHGNGTQAAFWKREDVFYGSVHVDPGAGWFPHVLGYADETGDGDGKGATLNVPLEPGTGDIEWIEAVARVCESAVESRAHALVVSLGVDAAADDPDGPLRVTEAGFAGAGRLLASLELPTVLVQEGGTHLPSLGPLVGTVLAGFGA